MPFVLRQVTPVRLSRVSSTTEGRTSLTAVADDDDDARQCISNQTLSACLRQLASLVALAADVFAQCHDAADDLHRRTVHLRQRLDRLQSDADRRLDSRAVAIPEGDLAAFSHHHKTHHFTSGSPPAATGTPTQVPALNLVTSSNRPKALAVLYDKAAELDISPPVNRPDSLLLLMANGDQGTNGCYLDAADYGRLMELGATLRRTRRKHRTNVLEIETRRPASLAHMRQWLSDDEGVLDDLSAPVGPDNRRPVDHTDSALPHRLPSPEEKAKVAASQVFPAEVVRLDVTGSGFERMTQFRRSLQHFEYVDAAAGATGGDQRGAERPPNGRKRSKKKSTRKRRNTIACDGDGSHIQHALRADALTRNDGEKSGSRSSLRQRLNLVHLLRTSLMTTPSTGSKGASAGSAASAVTSSDMSYDESDTNTQSINNTTTDATSHASSELVVQVTAGHLVTATRTRSGAMMNTISRLRRLGTDHTFVSGPPSAIEVDIHPAPNCSANGPSGDTDRSESKPRDVDLYELIPSEKEFGTLGSGRPVLRAVKLRVDDETKEDGRSSSGNWSASGSCCSARASLDSDHRRRHHHHHGRRHPAAVSPLAQRHPAGIQQQTTRSFSPEMDVDSALSGDDCSATTTSSIHRPDENGHHHNELDLETSSVYSCDAEGYYTSFHIDSGLKTLKEGQSDGSLHKNRMSVMSKETNGSERSSGMSSASGSICGGVQSVAATPENEYELFGKGSTLSSATTSSAGTVIFRPEGVNNSNSNSNSNSAGSRKKRNSQPPEPPPRNGGSNRNSVDSGQIRKQFPEENLRQLVTETESQEIADALKQLRTGASDSSIAPEVDGMRANLTQIERIPAMCVITPSITPLPSDDDFHDAAGMGRNSGTILQSHIQSAFLQQVAATDMRPHSATKTRVNMADLPATLPAAAESTPIVIKASIVKCPTDQELVALSQLPAADGEQLAAQPFSSAGSSESSRSSSLERKKRGARVTLDSDGKVVYSSDSLKRRKAQAGHTTFVEPGHSGQNQEKKMDPGTSAFRPNPIGSTGVAGRNASRPLGPPPYRPAPTFNGVRSPSTIPAVRTQPDGQSSSTGSGASSNAAVMVSRTDSYRLANVDVDSDAAGSFQRNRSDSYRKANQTLSVAGPLSSGVRLAPLSHNLSGLAVNGETRRTAGRTPAATGQFISGHLTDGWSHDRSPAAQPINYTIKSPILVKQISNPGLTAGQAGPSARPSRQCYDRQVSSPAMMTSSPLLVKPTNGVNNPNVAGRRIYGGPRLLVNPKVLTSPANNPINNNKSGSVSSLNSSGGSGLDISMTSQQHRKKCALASGFHGAAPPSPVVRPPTNAQDRPSFFNITPDGAGSSSRLNGASSASCSPLPGYQSLSPPPRMSALPLAQLSTWVASEFQRKDLRYNSLPARFKTVADYYAAMTGRSPSVEPDYHQHVSSTPSANKERRNHNTLPSPSKMATAAARRSGRESPEEGGFLEFTAKRSSSLRSSKGSTGNGQQQGRSSPTPSFSSCSLDGSFSTSSLNDSVDVRPGPWPSHPADAAARTLSSPQPKMVIHSIGLVKRTTISDFKRKLLQQLHHPASNKKLSAVEQLKATQPPPAGIVGNKGGAPKSPDLSPVTKHPALENLIRRSARVSYIASRLSLQQQQRNNRFHPHYSPRTDVLSSTIAEGRSEEELAAADDDTATVSSATSSNGASVRRHLSFQTISHRGSSTPSSGSSTPIETSL